MILFTLFQLFPYFFSLTILLFCSLQLKILQSLLSFCYCICPWSRPRIIPDEMVDFKHSTAPILFAFISLPMREMSSLLFGKRLWNCWSLITPNENRHQGSSAQDSVNVVHIQQGIWECVIDHFHPSPLKGMVRSFKG